MTPRFTPQAFEPLDEEEQLLMEAIEEEGWEIVAHLEAEKVRVMEAARHTPSSLIHKYPNARLVPRETVME